MAEIDTVYQIFKDFFTEDKVDIEQVSPYLYDIVVYFPEVKVTNEYGKYTIIKELYCRTQVASNGELIRGPEFKRSEYTKAELNYRYLHSHVLSLTNDTLYSWKACCLGRGPLLSTVSRLKCYYDEDGWLMYCHELDVYVTVESTKGVPYRRLEGLSHNGGITLNTVYSLSSYSNMISQISTPNSSPTLYYILSKTLDKAFKTLTFTYNGMFYEVACPGPKLVTTLTNLCIKAIHSSIPIMEDRRELYNLLLVSDCVYEEGVIKTWEATAALGVSYQEGHLVLQFKGKDIKLHVTDTKSKRSNTGLSVLRPIYYQFLLYKIIQTINGTAAVLPTNEERIFFV
jgi:hypothetical protein